MDDYVITNSKDDLDTVDIVIEEFQRNVNKFDRFLDNYRGHNPSIDAYHFYLEEITRGIVLPSLSHCLVDYFKAFHKLKWALYKIFVFIFMFSYLLLFEMHAHAYDKAPLSSNRI